MRKAAALLSFLVILPLTILSIILFLVSHSYHTDTESVLGNSSTRITYAAVPQFAEIAPEDIKAHDARVEMVRQFFARYKSPLEPYAKDVVASADEFGLDFRLIPAIAMQESTLCKKIPIGSHNCWGFGIYGGKVTRFDSYPEAIHTVTKTLALKYKKDGLHTPEEIMQRYTPSSNGSWAEGVNLVFKSLQ
jgi:hypothetical protein